jgi:hypothetical protein
MHTFSTLPSYVTLQLWFLNTLQFSKLIPRQGTQVYPRSCSCLPALWKQLEHNAHGYCRRLRRTFFLLYQSQIFWYSISGYQYVTAVSCSPVDIVILTMYLNGFLHAAITHSTHLYETIVFLIWNVVTGTVMGSTPQALQLSREMLLQCQK